MSLLCRRCLNTDSYPVCVVRRENRCAELCESRLGTKTKSEASSLKCRADSWKQNPVKSLALSDCIYFAEDIGKSKPGRKV